MIDLVVSVEEVAGGVRPGGDGAVHQVGTRVGGDGAQAGDRLVRRARRQPVGQVGEQVTKFAAQAREVDAWDRKTLEQRDRALALHETTERLKQGNTTINAELEAMLLHQEEVHAALSELEKKVAAEVASPRAPSSALRAMHRRNRRFVPPPVKAGEGGGLTTVNLAGRTAYVAKAAGRRAQTEPSRR
mgnify:CR=1 FL=1